MNENAMLFLKDDVQECTTLKQNLLSCTSLLCTQVLKVASEGKVSGEFTSKYIWDY